MRILTTTACISITCEALTTHNSQLRCSRPRSRSPSLTPSLSPSRGEAAPSVLIRGKNQIGY